MKKRIILIGVFCTLLVYIAWVLLPFDETIQVYDEVGLTNAQKSELVNYAKSINSFPNSTVNKLKRESRFTPWSRAELFISITGTKTNVSVMSGFYGGPLYGGGRGFTAEWIDGSWEFKHDKGAMWISLRQTEQDVDLRSAMRRIRAIRNQPNGTNKNAEQIAVANPRRHIFCQAFL